MHFINKNINFIFLRTIIFCTINDKLIIMTKLNLFFIILKKYLDTYNNTYNNNKFSKK